MKSLLLGICLLQLCACAQPDYLPTEAQQPVQEQESVCALAFRKANVCAQLEWKTNPDSSSAAEFNLKFDDENILLENLSVILWMPSMGHGSAPVRITEISPGHFRVFNVYFIMPGDWEVRIYLKENSVTLDQVYVPLMVP